jgi:uncharacterized membrane protein YcjF (UPF0283 family)
MRYLLTDFFLWLFPLAIGGYTMSYARWLWQQQNKPGALAVVVLALFSVLYPGIILFFIHR